MGLFRSRRSATSFVLDAYPVRIMLGLVMSLSLVLGLVHLPLQRPLARVGWSAQSSGERIALQEVRRATETERSDAKNPASDRSTSALLEEAPPPTVVQSPSPEVASPPSPDGSEHLQDDTTGDLASYSDVQEVTTLGLSEGSPRIVGGMGSLYLHIDYPQAALEQGIEGRLQLEFTVGTDGAVSNLQVVDPLHPLCDSAAVRGVRSVTFVPAKRDGRPIPIRLRLPVRFQLSTAPNTALKQ